MRTITSRTLWSLVVSDFHLNVSTVSTSTLYLCLDCAAYVRIAVAHRKLGDVNRRACKTTLKGIQNIARKTWGFQCSKRLLLQHVSCIYSFLGAFTNFADDQTVQVGSVIKEAVNERKMWNHARCHFQYFEHTYVRFLRTDPVASVVASDEQDREREKKRN